MAHTAKARIAAKGCRRPRGCRGSGTWARTSRKDNANLSPIKPQQMLVLSMGLLARDMASILAYSIATGYHPGDIILQTPQIQKWHWLTQIAV